MQAADDGPPTDRTNVVSLPDTNPATAKTRLAPFIRDNTDDIIAEWSAFAQTLVPAAAGLSPCALRDHIHQILRFIEADITSHQTQAEQAEKSRGGKRQPWPVTAAQTHAAIRFAGGFDIGQITSEYRALRASVLKLWTGAGPALDATDLTDMIRFNEAIDQELAESVNFYTQQVAQSRELVVGMLAHDLRSPLQAIQLSTELALHMGQLNERHKMLSTKVLESTKRMDELIDRLLDVTRARLGAGMPVVRALMNLRMVVEQIVDEVRVVHPDRVIELVTFGISVGEWDKPRIGQIVSNLLNNALQYGSRSAPVRVSLTGALDTVTLMVANEGVPIPADKIGMIFDALTRLTNEDAAPASSNLGLGLFITNEVVQAHGGTIEVTSSDPGGTVFTVTLPRVRPDPEDLGLRRLG